MGGPRFEHLCGTVAGKGSFPVVLRWLNVAGCSFLFFFLFPLLKSWGFFIILTDLLATAISKWYKMCLS